MRPPNVLVLMTDEHRADVAGFAGDPVVRTPHLDALAEQAVLFENAYTPSPICVPARQCLAAGIHPRRLGVEKMGQDLPPGSMTFARRFSQYGYQSAACGKLHHMGPDQMQGWRRRFGADLDVHTPYVAGRDPEAFAHFTEQGSFKWPMVDELRKAGLGHNPWADDDEYAVLGAENFIRRFFVDPFYNRATPHTPLLLKVSLNEPHYPFATERRDLFEHYLPRVSLRSGERFDHSFLGERFVARPGVEITEREARNAVAAYYTMVTSADERIGRVLAALERAGQDLDDWIVVFTSDHGEMLGEHGVWEKQKFFEGSARVPLLVRWPRRFGPRRVRANVNLVDLFATLCELTGVPAPDGLDSRSLVPLLEGSGGGWDDESISQFGGTNLMLKRGDLKYSWYAEDSSEVLFDLAVDPTEDENLATEPRYREALAQFRRRRAELDF